MNTTDVQKQISLELPDYQFKTVKCPGNIKREKGFKFVCRGVSTDGAHTIINGSEPVQDGELQFDVPKNEAVDTANLVAFLKSKLKEQTGFDTNVYCGTTANIPVDNGTLITCTAAPPGGKVRKVIVTAHPTADDVSVEHWKLV